MLRYRAVLFDLDGTLVDSYAALADAVNFALRQHGLGDLPEGRVRDLVGDGVEKLLQRAFDQDEIPASARDAFERRYDEVCCVQSTILDDVEPTLAELSRRGMAMAVCTNKPTHFSRKILDYLGLASHFCAVVGPDLAGARKPDPRHLLCALQATGVAASAALFVGDMPVDVQAARNSGIAVAVVPTGSSTPEELRRANADHYLERFSELLDLIAVEVTR